jgi:hypothetical protein
MEGEAALLGAVFRLFAAGCCPMTLAASAKTAEHQRTALVILQKLKGQIVGLGKFTLQECSLMSVLRNLQGAPRFINHEGREVTRRMDHWPRGS